MAHSSSCIIIGGGYGGLLCGAILAKHGYAVTVIDQNKQMGGCLQSFGFQKELFDSCVHYIGGLDEGQNQRKIFDYLGITEHLQLKRLSDKAFDTVIIDGKSYYLPQGYAALEAQLVAYFPYEKENIRKYIQAVQDCCAAVPLYNLSDGDGQGKAKWSQLGLQSFLSELGISSLLQKVLTGNSLLYAGDTETTSFMTHALIINSYISGAYTFEKGSAQLTKALSQVISENGGKLVTKTAITTVHCEGDQIACIEDASGKQWKADSYIANIHPDRLLNLLVNDPLRMVYKKRILHAKNSCSALMLNCILAPQTIPYTGSNIYYTSDMPLEVIDKKDEHYFALYLNEDKKYPGYASSVALLAYACMDDYAAWQDSKNITALPQVRAKDYEAFKTAEAERLLAFVAKENAALRTAIISYQVATPLTFRDYMGSKDGSMYGIVKDINQPMLNQIPTQTKLSNLFFTGQNVNLHGILGVSLSALQTCGHFMDNLTLLSDIRKA